MSVQTTQEVQFEGKHADLTGKIIGAFFQVYNQMGYGFPERVYQNALAIELNMAGFYVEPQCRIEVRYDGHLVGEFFADLLVDKLVIVELKAVRQVLEEHHAQLLSYLKATPFEIGLLLNFGPKAEYFRKIYDNDRKKYMVIQPGE